MKRVKLMKRFFSYTNEGGLELHDTLEEAKKESEDNLDYFRDLAASEGWDDEV